MARRAPTTQMSTDHLRKMGFDVAKVEHYNSYSRRYNDLFGIFDLLAMKEGEGLIGIQTTSASNHADRRKKILSSDLALTWLASGGRIRVHGWRKDGRFWKVNDEEIDHGCFEETAGAVAGREDADGA